MSLSDLSKGLLTRMFQEDAATIEPGVLQILTVKAIPQSKEGIPTRYRTILSDGEYFAQAMLASQVTPKVDSGELARHSLVRVPQYALNKVNDRQIIIILELDVVGGPTPERLGEPTSYDKRSETTSTAAPGPQVKPETGAGAGFYANNNNNNNGAGAGAPQRAAVKQSSTIPVDLSNAPVYPIEGLSPYQNKWMIKARVVNKSDIKHWSNARGEGKLFSCNFLDESGEIKATAFNDQVDRLYTLLKEGHVYMVSKGKVGIARKKFSNLSNEYEISFERDTQVVECMDASDVPEIKFDFKKVDQLESLEPKQTCDIIGIVETVGDVGEITSKTTQKPVSKRELGIVDQSGMIVRLTLWGKAAETYGTPQGQPGCAPDDHPVIAFKGVSVGDFGGRSLSMFSSSTMHVNPDIPEAHGVRGWYDAEGFTASSNNAFKSFQAAGLGGTGTGAGDLGMNSRERKLISTAKDEQLGMSEKPDYFNVKASIIYIKNENLYYPACPKDGCNKKVTEENGTWRCEKCDMSYDKPEYRYIIMANVQDHSGQIWINGFNDVGNEIVGMTANELNDIKQGDDESRFQETLERANGKTYVFNIRAKQDTFNDTPRVRYTVTKMTLVDFVKEGNDLAEAIKKEL